MSMTNTDELIVYSNSHNGLGIRILGAKRPTNKSGIFIKQLLDAGLAQRDGRLKVGDQILSINNETTIGVNREYAVNILRSAAATNQVCLHVRHFFPTLSSNEYQKLLFDEKSTDDDDDNSHQILNYNYNTNEIPLRRSIRKHRHSTYNSPLDNRKYQEEQNTDDRMLQGLNISHDAIQSLLNSRFKLIDLIDLLKKLYPELLSNDPKRELHFIQELSQTNTDNRMTLKDFERQSSLLLGEHINLLTPFYSLSSRSSTTTDDKLRHEISMCRSTIDELENQIVICEQSQRLSEQVELEYEDLFKFVYKQLSQFKLNEINQLKQIQENDQLIQKLFHYFSSYVNNSTGKPILSQFKYQYEQQQKFLPLVFQQNSHDTSSLSNNKYQHQI